MKYGIGKGRDMKKRYLFISILTNIIAISMIPLNLFLFHTKEWVTLLFAGLTIAVFLLFVVKGNGKKRSQILLGAFMVFTVFLTLVGTFCNPYWNSVTFKNWENTKAFDSELSYSEAEADLDFAMHYLKKVHPLFLDGVPENVSVEYKKALEDLQKAERIDVTLLNQKLQNILSVLQEGHTCSYAAYGTEHYMKYTQQSKENGETLMAVNGMELLKLLEEKSDLYSYEVESWGLRQLKQDLSTLEGLAFLDIPVGEGVSYTFEDPDGNQRVITCQKEDFVTYEEYVSLYGQEEEEEDEPFVSYEIDMEHDLAVLTLMECHYNDTYKNVLRDMFTEVADNGIANVAVDIRNNGGGNSMVIDEFLHYLDIDTYKTDTYNWRLGMFIFPMGKGIMENKKYTELTFGGNVYVLTSSGTFSSAMMFAEYIKDNHLGTIIGEAPGNIPSGYGDITIFQLPESGLYMHVSTKKFFRADKESDDFLVSPDMECNAEDAFAYLYEVLDK